eukprot:comp6000_c0_seq1/m.1848 comp6000_c0_seq1/g.1848  ORF comp6000_c0_seq1/g.1848 comp6000_c0_seq1/m.1848 type:complete len:704 (-) comp6000_c0_seq1:370-2481(-)
MNRTLGRSLSRLRQKSFGPTKNRRKSDLAAHPSIDTQQSEESTTASFQMPLERKVSEAILCMDPSSRQRALKDKIEDLAWQLETEEILLRKLATMDVTGRPPNFVQELDAQKEQIQGNIDLINDVMALHQQALDDLRADHNDLSSVSLAQSNASVLVAAKDGEISELTDKLEAQTVKTREAEVQVEALRGRVVDLETELGELRTRHGDLGREQKDLQEYCQLLQQKLDQNESDVLSARLSLATAAMVTVQKEKEDLSVRVKGLESEMASLMETVERLESEREELVKERDALDQEVNELNAAALEFGRVKTKLASSESNLASAVQREAEYQKELQAMEERDKALTAKAEELAKERRQIEGVKVELEQERVKRKETEEERERWKTIAEEREKVCGEKDVEMALMATQIDELNILCQDSQVQIQEQRHKLEETEGGLMEARAQVEEMTQRLTSTISERDTLQKELAQLRSTLDETRKQMLVLESERDAARTSEQQLQIRITALESEMRERGREGAEQAQVLAHLRATVDASESEKERAAVRLAEELAEARRVLDLMHEKVGVLEADKGSKDRQIADLTQALREVVLSRDRHVADIQSARDRDMDLLRADNSALLQTADARRQDAERRADMIEARLQEKERAFEELQRELEYQRQNNDDLNKHLMRTMEEKMDMTMQLEQWQHDYQAAMKRREKKSNTSFPSMSSLH